MKTGFYSQKGNLVHVTVLGNGMASVHDMELDQYLQWDCIPGDCKWLDESYDHPLVQRAASA